MVKKIQGDAKRDFSGFQASSRRMQWIFIAFQGIYGDFRAFQEALVIINRDSDGVIRVQKDFKRLKGIFGGI